MDIAQILPPIKQMIGEGNLEPALVKLIELLDSDPAYAELAQIARINQADLYQNKAGMLKGTVSNEDSRLVMNQLTDNVLQIISRVESGRLYDAPAEGKNTSNAWRYYVAGGIVALAAGIIIWRLLGGGFSKDAGACPNYGDTYKWKVMVLPFKNTGEKGDTEYQISDGLNKLILQTANMKTQIIADVNETYDIDANYPNPAEAADIARNCDAQMIVWGKINTSSSAGYKLDVFYKLLDAGGVQLTGDTTLSSLLQIKEDGQQLVSDVNAVVRLLYVVLANQSRTPIAANFFKEDTATKMSAANSPADTAMILAMADNLVQNGQKDEAIKLYDSVLEAYPSKKEARVKRGALLFEKGDYAGAARDLEVAAPEAGKASQDVLRVRVEAALKSGQPDKAKDDLNYIKTQKAYEGAWLRSIRTEINDSLLVSQVRRDKKEKMANNQPQNTRAQIDAGRANIALGDSDRAIKNADKALKINPKNQEAYEIKIVANAHKGDTAQVRKQLEKAEKEGINVKGILNKLPPIIQLQYQNNNKDN